jgi:hypothetical protein
MAPAVPKLDDWAARHRCGALDQGPAPSGPFAWIGFLHRTGYRVRAGFEEVRSLDAGSSCSPGAALRSCALARPYAVKPVGEDG